MKRIHLIEWGIIAVGLIFGFKLFENFFSMLIALIYGYGLMEELAENVIKWLVILGIYGTVFIVLIKKSYSIAKTINGNNPDETIPISIGKKSLLQVILIGISIVSILSNLTKVILYIFEVFKKEGNFRTGADFNPTDITKYNFQVAVGETILALIVLFCAKDIVNWFVRKDEVDELVFESKTGNDSNDV